MQTPVETGTTERRVVTVGEFVDAVPELTTLLWGYSRCVVLIGEFSDGRYVQFWGQGDGTLRGEVISNLNIQPLVVLSPYEEQLLRSLGWHVPVAQSSPNWSFDANDAEGLRALSCMVAETITGVFTEPRDALVRVTTFLVTESPRTSRGIAPHEQRRRYFVRALSELEESLSRSV